MIEKNISVESYKKWCDSMKKIFSPHFKGIEKSDMTKLEQIVKLAFDLSPNNYSRVCQNCIPFSRAMEIDNLLLSIHIFKKDTPYESSGIHLCIMKNLDLHARRFPYYDGAEDNLVMVHNQQAIRELITNVGYEKSGGS